MYQKLKSLLDCKISRFLNFLNFFEKLNFLPSKKHLAFLTIERYDIELKSKFHHPPGGAQAPKGGSF